jgi:iron(III) transport system permease protein
VKNSNIKTARHGALASSKYSVYVALVPVFFIFAGYVIYPLYKTFVTSIQINGNIDYANYAKFFNLSSSANVESLINSIVISVLSVVTCGVIGCVLAFLLEKFDFPGRRILKVCAIVPMALPALIGTMSFKFLYGESGIIPRFLQWLFHLDKVPFYLQGMAGVLMVHTFTMYTYFFLPVSASLRSFDYSLEEAAYGLGSNRRRVFFKVILPMLTPTLVASSLLVFMMSMASYTAPLIYGIDRTLTMQIFLSRTNGNLSMASTQSTILSLVSILFLIILRLYESRRSYYGVGKGVASTRIEVKSNLVKAVTIVMSFLLVLILLLPIFVIILTSFSVDGKWTTQIIPDQYTLKHYVDLFADSKTWRPIKNSLNISGLATAANVLFGVAVAYVMNRRSFKGKMLTDILIMIPWTLPGTVVAINLIAAFNVPSMFSFGNVWVNTFWIMPLAYFVRHLPLVYRSTSANLAQTDVSTEEAARSLGATWWSSFCRVVLPMAFGAIMSGLLLGFVQGIGEFVASILLYNSSTIPISVAINQKLYSFKYGGACAYGVLQIILLFVVLFINEKISGSSSSS